MDRANIVEVCQSIIQPPAPLSLRTSGYLLLGVVRIHDGKQKVLVIRNLFIEPRVREWSRQAFVIRY